VIEGGNPRLPRCERGKNYPKTRFHNHLAFSMASSNSQRIAHLLRAETTQTLLILKIIAKLTGLGTVMPPTTFWGFARTRSASGKNPVNTLWQRSPWHLRLRPLF